MKRSFIRIIEPAKKLDCQSLNISQSFITGLESILFLTMLVPRSMRKSGSGKLLNRLSVKSGKAHSSVSLPKNNQKLIHKIRQYSYVTITTHVKKSTYDY